MTIPARFTLATQISAGVRRSPLGPVCRGEEGLRVEILLHDVTKHRKGSHSEPPKQLAIDRLAIVGIVQIKPSGQVD